MIETCSEFGYRHNGALIPGRKEISKDEIVKRVTSQLHPGAIVLGGNNATDCRCPAGDYQLRHRKWLQIVPISALYKDDYYNDPNDGARCKITRQQQPRRNINTFMSGVTFTVKIRKDY